MTDFGKSRPEGRSHISTRANAPDPNVGATLWPRWRANAPDPNVGAALWPRWRANAPDPNVGAALWPRWQRLDLAQWLRLAVATVLVGAALATSLPASAQVYRWVDADGTVNYSDRPPPSQTVEQTGIRSEPTDLEATLREQVERERQLELRAEQRADAAEDAADRAEYEARLARSCEQARERLATVERARRLSRVDEDGTRRDYDDAERAAALAEARAQVAEWCR